MGKKLFKRFTSLVVAIMMILSVMAIPAFATETTEKMAAEEENFNQKLVTEAESLSGASTRENAVVGTTVEAWGEAWLHPSMSSYVGLQKSFHVATGSDATSGGVFLYLYNSKGELISNDWSMGVNDYYYWTFTLPSSGTYTLHVVAMTDQPVRVYANWD